MRIWFNFTSWEHQCAEDWNGQSSGQHLMPMKDLMKREPKGCSWTCVSMVRGYNDGWCVWVNHFSWTRLYWSTFPQCFYSKHPFWEADTVIYHTEAGWRECFVFVRISVGSLFCRPGFYSPSSPPHPPQCDKAQKHKIRRNKHANLQVHPHTIAIGMPHCPLLKKMAGWFEKAG